MCRSLPLTTQEHFPVLIQSPSGLAETLKDSVVAIVRAESLRTVMKVLVDKNAQKAI